MDIVLFLLIVLKVSTNVVFSEYSDGNSVSCENEGEEIPVPQSKASDPCTVCYCRSGEISCYSRKCPALEGCHQVLYPKPAGQCCSSCKSCTYKGKDYKNGDEWADPNDSCQKFKCLAGVITTVEEKCYVPCKNPIHVTGQCCPVCKGCEVDGHVYEDGEKFKSGHDKCVNCECKNGTSQCTKVGCPVLNCPRQFWKKSSDSCCAHCTGSRTVFNLRGFCLYQTHVYRTGISFKPDRCTTCECKAGTIVCRGNTCPILDCPIEEILPSTGECCPRCRPKKSCEASDGNTYKHAENWKKSQCTTCTCDNGNVNCIPESCNNDLNCPKNHRLIQLPGQCCPSCVEGDATCAVFGDPHYKTYDGMVYHFQGKCKYILTKTCSGDGFEVIVSNRARMTNSYSWTKSALVKYNGSQILLNQMLKVRVDRKRISMPFVKKYSFDVRRDGQAVVLTTKSGIKVIWDGDSYLEVNIPSTFKRKMCGLCGNYNGITADDMTGSDNQIYYNVDDFGKTWRTGDEKHCHVIKTNVIQAPCRGPSMKRLLAHHECAAFYGTAFAPCRERIDVRPYYKACVMDVCDCPENQQCSCEALVAYSRACEKELDFYLNWRTPNLCGAPKCQIGAIYDTCTSACPETCHNYGYNRRKCNRPCVAGCRCLPGMVLHHDRCITTDQCPNSKTPEPDGEKNNEKSRKGRNKNKKKRRKKNKNKNKSKRKRTKTGKNHGTQSDSPIYTVSDNMSAPD